MKQGKTVKRHLCASGVGHEGPDYQYRSSRRGLAGRWIRASAVGASLALLAAACGSASSGAAKGTSRGSNANVTNSKAFVTTASWGPTSWSYNPYALSGAFLGFGVQLPLAIPEKSDNETKMFSLVKQLMSSYTVTKLPNGGHMETLHLVKGAKFSNGEPVDSTDVMDSILLMGVDQEYIFDQDVTGVSAPNATTVDFSFGPHVYSTTYRGWLAGFYVVPMSQYGQFLPKGIESTLLAYNKLVQNPATAATATKSAAYKTINALTKKLQAYNPKTLIGDGPFELTGAATATATEVKSPTYFGAKNVHVEKLELVNTVSSPTVYPLLYSHDIDWYRGTPSTTELSSWKATSGAHTDYSYADLTENLLFNDKRYPFTLTPVRQALAYVINRKTLVETEDGGAEVGSLPTTHPDGLGIVENHVWLSPSQRASLIEYNYDPSKATKLLDHAGFKKVAGQWIMPNGKQFTTSVTGSAGNGPSGQNEVLFSKEVAAMLTSFGIKTSASAVPATSYTAITAKGQFQIAWAEGVGTNLDPICGVETGGLGGPTNYAFGSNGAFTAGEPGIGFGPTANVPGIGTVKVSQTVTKECQSTPSGARMGALAWDWARLVNEEVPFLTYANDRTVILYSSHSYSDYPPANSWLWSEAGIFPTQALYLMIENGYIRPASA